MSSERLRRSLPLALVGTLAGAAAGVVLGWRDAWSEIGRQGYEELGFERTTHAILTAAVRAGALEGVTLAGLAALAVVLVHASPLGASLRAGPVLEWLAGPRRRAVLGLVAAEVAAFALAAEYRQPELFALLGLGLAAGLVLALVGGPALEHASTSRRAALVALAWIAPLVCVAPFAIVHLQRIYPSIVPTLGVGAAGAAVGLTVAFLALRRSARIQLGAATGLPAAWTRLALGAVGLGAVALAVVPLLLPGLADRFPPGLVARRPTNVLLIAIDTLRADHTTLAGAPGVDGVRDRTPNLRALARRGIVFEQAISQASWTMPAMASIVTGEYPLDHGAVAHRSYLRPSEVLISEVLREAGYATGSVVSNYYVDTAHGFAQGIDEMSDHLLPDVAPQPAAAVTDEALAFVRRHAAEPFYLLAHYMDPHYEYRDQPDLDWDAGYDGWLRGRHLGFDDMVKNRHLMERADLDHLRALYDEEIAHTDREIGRLLDALGDDVLANTLVIVVADHGEEFMEHGQLFHTTSLHGELLRVPLVVVPPASWRRDRPVPDRVEGVVETRAIFATVLDVLGIDFQSGRHGPSLLPPAQPRKGDGDADERLAFALLWQVERSRTEHMVFNQAAVRSERWKLIWDQTRGQQRFYDLARDPGEQHALAEPPAEAQRLRGLLDAFLAPRLESADVPELVEPDPELRAMLEELGYL